MTATLNGLSADALTFYDQLRRNRRAARHILRTDMAKPLEAAGIIRIGAEVMPGEAMNVPMVYVSITTEGLALMEQPQ